MASKGKLNKDEMEKLLFNLLRGATNNDLDFIDKKLFDQKMITRNEFYQLRGTANNVYM